MKKATYVILAILLCVPFVSLAQWEFENVMPLDSAHTANAVTHGIAVDPDGYVWTHRFFNWSRWARGEGDTINVDGLWRISPDGTTVDTILAVTLADTLFPLQGGRGMRADHNGNILAAYAHRLFRVDYQTHEVLDVYEHPNGLALTTPGVDAQGNIYIGTVLAEAPVRVYDADFNFIMPAITPTGISRSLEVTQDGLTLFYLSPGENAVLKYTRADEFDVFPEVPDTILQGMRVVSAMVNRATGHLWVSAGDNAERPNQYPDVETEWEPFTWYEYDIENDQVLNHITWFNIENSWRKVADGVLVPAEPWEDGAHGPWPRAIAFDNEGTTAYIGHWTYAIIPAIQKWTFTDTPVVTLPESNWNFVDVFPDAETTQWQHSAHGVAVDDEGKVWVSPYYSRLFVPTEGDTIRRNPVYVFNADGTPADFSPVYEGEINGEIVRFGPVTGLNRDHEGNILVAIHGTRPLADGSTWDASTAHIVRVNAETGEFMGMGDVTYMRTETAAQAPNRPAVTEDGYIGVSFVFPGSPIIILDPDFELVQAVTEDGKSGFSRTFEISADGTYLYNPSTTLFTTVYYSEFGVLGEYEIVDTTLGMWLDPGAVSRDPVDDNILWMTATGSGNNPLPEDNPYYNHSSKVFAFDLTTGEIVDYAESPGDFRIPRALAFSPDGEIMYVGTFSMNVPLLHKFTKEPVSVRPSDRTIAENFSLSQNYPNPFNPSTTIQFSLPTQTSVRLDIYNMLGQRVKTLVADEMLQAGNYDVVWNGTNDQNITVPSGMYIYRITAGNFVDSKRMMFLK